MRMTLDERGPGAEAMSEGFLSVPDGQDFVDSG